MIFLILDFLLSYFCKTPTFFFLLNFLLIKKNNYPKFLIILLVLDLLILNTYFLNTIICSLLFLLYKKLKITKINIKNYLLSLILIYLTFVPITGLINGYSINYIFPFLLKNWIINFIFYLICYKLEFKNIQLSRWL